VNDHVNGNGKSGKRATIADVARVAGVSRQTVSRAINDKGEISDDTRERVLAAVREMGYRPSSLARGLKTSRSGLLGLVVPDIANPFFAETARGATEAASDDGYTVLLCNTDEHPEREGAILRQLEGQRVEGIVLISSRLSDGQLDQVLSGWVPTVLVNREWQTAPGRGSVVTDERRAMGAAVDHLVERGHRRIGFVGCTARSRSGRERQRGFLDACRRWDIEVDDAWCCECAPYVDAGREAALGLLSGRPELSALLCYNDLVAVGAVQACRRLGLAVPDDCAIVGWDDIALARYLSPPLTTLDMPKAQSGAEAVALLTRMIADDSLVPEAICLQAGLVIRQST